MTTGLFLIQALNGLQLAMLLFLLSVGLSVVFGLMNFINLAHGSIYMLADVDTKVDGKTDLNGQVIKGDSAQPARTADAGMGALFAQEARTGAADGPAVGRLASILLPLWSNS